MPIKNCTHLVVTLELSVTLCHV